MGPQLLSILLVLKLGQGSIDPHTHPGSTIADKTCRLNSCLLPQELRLAQAEVQRLRSELTAFATQAKDEAEEPREAACWGSLELRLLGIFARSLHVVPVSVSFLIVTAMQLRYES